MSTEQAYHEGEPHLGTTGRLNWLRAGVLGANDGIVSTAALVVGVAGATTALAPILTAGVAGLLAGAVSMALGEYVSVSSQRDAERSLLEKERRELEADPEAELEELTRIYEDKGLSRPTAERVAAELTEHDAFAAHAEAELGISPHRLVSPWQAAIASFVAFALGAVLPLVAVLLPPEPLRVPVTFAAVLVALALTGSLGARLGGAGKRRAALRVVVGGALAMAVTYGIGALLGVAV